MTSAASTMSTLRYRVVDVFTATRYAGNPLAVVLGADHLDAPARQRVAAEFNLSETSFLMAPTAPGADYQVAIHTPAVELPFAGHPSVGAAWVLHDEGLLAAGDRVQECGAGLLPVAVSATGAALTGGPALDEGQRDAGPLLAAVGLDVADLDAAGGAHRAGCGIPFTYLAVRPDALARLTVDLPSLRALQVGTGLSVYAYDPGTRTARSRVFVPDVGIAEDPATGSAAVGLGVVLAATGRATEGTTDYLVTQGVEMGRPSHMRCTVTVADATVTRTTVAGDVVGVARGELTLPD